MTVQEHAQIVSMESQGKLLVGVDPAAARKFFTDLSAHAIAGEIGESIALRRVVVVASWLLGPLSLIASWVLATLSFGWWAIAVCIGSLAAWAAYNGRASIGNQKIIGVTWFLAMAIAACFFDGVNVLLQAWIALLAASFFFARLTYYSAVKFIRALVLKNAKAFEFLFDKALVLREVG